LRGLDWVNFFGADVSNAVGPFLAIYLATARHWNAERVGIIIAAQTLATVLAEGPAGWMVDWSSRKKVLLILPTLVIASGCLATVYFRAVVPLFITECMIGAASAFTAPTISAISLGIVGKSRLSKRIGRNQSFNSAGNVAAALSAGLLGSLYGEAWIFYFSAIASAVAIASIALIRESDIDQQAARAGSGIHCAGFRELLRDRRLLTFTSAVVLFHLANAAMLPLVGERLTTMSHKATPIFMSACVTLAQVVIIFVSAIVGHHTDTWGRKPIFATAFAVLAVRGLLFALGHSMWFLLCVQTLDGIGAGIFGVIWVVIVSDLAKGTGRFNALQGAIQMAQGAGAAGSNYLAGAIAHHLGFSAAFYILAGIAAFGLLFFACFMPETRDAAQADRASFALA
jgi:MFS family permease